MVGFKNFTTPSLRLEKNIPIPESSRGRKGYLYPENHEMLKKMEIGDSVLFYLESPEQAVTKNKRLQAFKAAAYFKYQYKIVTRKEGATVRVWRTE